VANLIKVSHMGTNNNPFRHSAFVVLPTHCPSLLINLTKPWENKYYFVIIFLKWQKYITSPLVIIVYKQKNGHSKVMFVIKFHLLKFNNTVFY